MLCIQHLDVKKSARIQLLNSNFECLFTICNHVKKSSCCICRKECWIQSIGKQYSSNFRTCVKILFWIFCSASVFQSMLARPEYRWAMPVGSCTVLSTAFSQTDKCQVIKLSVVEMTPSTLSSVKLEPENTFQELCLLIWNQLLLVRD